MRVCRVYEQKTLYDTAFVALPFADGGVVEFFRIASFALVNAASGVTALVQPWLCAHWPPQLVGAARVRHTMMLCARRVSVAYFVLALLRGASFLFTLLPGTAAYCQVVRRHTRTHTHLHTHGAHSLRTIVAAVVFAGCQWRYLCARPRADRCGGVLSH